MPRKTVTLFASVPLTYQGRSISVGESFQASPADAAALHYQRKASFTRSRRSRTRDMVPAADESRPTTRRQYKRRDMVPEP